MKATDKEFALARIYAAAILEVAETQGQADAVLTELTELRAHLDAGEDFRDFFSSPTVDAALRERMVEKLFRGKLTDVLVDAMQVMNRKGRLHLLVAVAETYRLALKELQGHVDVYVRSAVSLSVPLREELRGWARAYSGKEPELVESIDPSLVGGFIVQLADQKFDASLAMRLELLEERMLQRSSQEIHLGKTYLQK